MEAVSAGIPHQELEESTVEANPATVDDEKVQLLAAYGVNRVSMGAQSFVSDELAALERLHSPEDIEPSVAILRRNGIEQVNLDLIFGIPGQTMSTWAVSLQQAIALGPDHVACYGLTFEPGTRLAALREAGRTMPCDESLEADMYLHAIDTLAGAGYEQYEISNFAKPGCRCRHNLAYWRNEPYIGVGPSAAGYVGNQRYKNIADVAGYMRMIDTYGHAEAESESIDTSTLMTEMIMMQLRLVEGLSIDAFQRRTGSDPVALFGGVLARLAESGHVTASETHIALTRKGRLTADAVIADLADACDHRRPASCVSPCRR
jgi:oxygen-independent coproporphyrinogen-3 oxidase